ncbi:Hepatocyte growth factor receptor [Geodia barretti]|uniref:receptor protein-tyrosine kinase n=1 Tax=Geodia barretti TaxID=519541 RepID=A0AA35S4D3_GEOBA|nr:Hepatocyte growth factor receptor [Geodia barretti]
MEGATYSISIEAVAFGMLDSPPTQLQVSLVAVPETPVIDRGSIVSTASTISFSWSVPHDVTHSLVTWQAVDSVRGPINSATVDKLLSTYSITGLRSNTNHEVTVRVFNPAGSTSSGFNLSTTADSRALPDSLDNGTITTSSMTTTGLITIGSSIGSISLLVLLITVAIIVFIIIRRRAKRIKTEPDFRGKLRQEDSIDLQTDSKAQSFEVPESEKEEELLLNLKRKKLIVSKVQVHLSSTIGKGEFGLVYKGYVESDTGTTLVAIKTSKALSSEVEKKNLLREISKMASFEHNHVMSLLGVCLDSEMPLMIMPLMVKGSVLEYVRKIKENPPQDNIVLKITFLRMCHQITKGMKYLASCKFVHRDLAARNCMIDQNDVIKVADFGLSEDIHRSGYFFHSKEDVMAREEKVPIRWMAPESIESGRYSEKTDVVSS